MALYESKQDRVNYIQAAEDLLSLIIIIIIVIPLLHFGAITTYHRCSRGSNKSFGYCCFFISEIAKLFHAFVYVAK